ncbi:MAG: hypothetical protein M1482_03415 [Chloroflexi bacterium]|nr:hypothetical protein [Chloroflexota bacterium]
MMPLALAGLALVVQVIAVPLENDDPAAFGDNIGGLVFLVPFFIFALVYFWRTRTSTSTALTTPGVQVRP